MTTCKFVKVLDATSKAWAIIAIAVDGSERIVSRHRFTAKAQCKAYMAISYLTNGSTIEK